ncbi:hypothetical protein Bbelb_087230 [Branchiostoma belcheri]|nr:hypothetical protein Bbelb_401090 [Branchiostoma belcheri]KAI8514399.1 hypothetical protein Bbelb_087230 [Branchiostoma belcheri]
MGKYSGALVFAAAHLRACAHHASQAPVHPHTDPVILFIPHGPTQAALSVSERTRPRQLLTHGPLADRLARFQTADSARVCRIKSSLPKKKERVSLRSCKSVVCKRFALPPSLSPLETQTGVGRSSLDTRAYVARVTVDDLSMLARSIDHSTKTRNTAETRGMYVRTSIDSRLHRGELQASYARAGNELCDLKNRQRLVADVKNTFRVSASFGRLQKIVGDPENSRDARRNIGRTTAVNVV